MTPMWTVEALDSTVESKIRALPADVRARLVRYSNVIEEQGPDALPPKASKHLGDGLWELRLQGPDGIGRALYVTAMGRRVVIVRAFVKKTQKTPKQDMKLAPDRVRTMS